ncbi:hypothetical protein Tco_1524007 [Tanacetum coccineum]
MASELLATPSELARDNVKILVTPSGSNRLKETLEDSAKRWRQDYKATPCDGKEPMLGMKGTISTTKVSIPAVMDAHTIPVSAEENLGDPIDIRVDIIHPEPVAAVAFPAAAVVRIQAQHGEAIRGILEHLQGVRIEEEMSTLRFRMGMAEAENVSLRGKIKTMEAIEMVTRSQEKRACMEMERQLTSVQES